MKMSHVCEYVNAFSVKSKLDLNQAFPLLYHTCTHNTLGFTCKCAHVCMCARDTSWGVYTHAHVCWFLLGFFQGLSLSICACSLLSHVKMCAYVRTYMRVCVWLLLYLPLLVHPSLHPFSNIITIRYQFSYGIVESIVESLEDVTPMKNLHLLLYWPLLVPLSSILLGNIITIGYQSLYKIVESLRERWGPYKCKMKEI